MIKIVNIRDVAKAADVSVATVSHVINRNYFVSEHLIKRVNKAIKDLNYSPNLVAGSLRRKKTGTIGLIVPDNSNPFFAELSKNIENSTYLLGYNIFICNSSYDIKRELNNLDMLISKRVDGILIIPETNEDTLIEKAKNSGIPLVLIERNFPNLFLDKILINHFKAGYESANYLIGLGHKKIIFIDRKSDKFHSIERKRGYKQALKDNKIKIDNRLIIRGGKLFVSGYEIVEVLVKNHLDTTAILCFEDIEAIGAINAAKKFGLKVPEDISIVGYGDLSFSKYLVPELTTIYIPIAQIAIEAVKVLNKRIKNPNIKNIITKVIEPELVIRQSTRKIS